MNYTKIVSILDDHFCEKWFEFVFTIIDKSTIDLINLLDTKYLTKEIFDNITFKVENSECFISYKNFKNIKTSFEVENVELIHILTMYNPNFGKDVLINYLDTLSKQEFIDIFNGYEFDTDWSNELDNNINFSFDIIMHYIDKYNIEINKDCINLIGHQHYFWYMYYEYQPISLELLEKYIDLEFIWPVLIINNENIDLDFVNKHRETIKKSISFTNFTDNSDEMFDKLLNFCLLCNKNTNWEFKKNILENYSFYENDIPKSFCQYTYKYQVDYFKVSEFIKYYIKFPYKILKDMITNPNTMYFKQFNYIIKYKDLIEIHNLPQDLIEYSYKNHIKLLEYDILNEDTKKHLYCKYDNLTPDLLEKYKQPHHNLYLDCCNGLTWYQFDKYPYLKKYLDEYGYGYEILIDMDGIGKNEYYADNLYLHKNASIIQNAWRLCRYDPNYTMCKKVQLRNLDMIEKEHNMYLNDS